MVIYIYVSLSNLSKGHHIVTLPRLGGHGRQVVASEIFGVCFFWGGKTVVLVENPESLLGTL